MRQLTLTTVTAIALLATVPAVAQDTSAPPEEPDEAVATTKSEVEIPAGCGDFWENWVLGVACGRSFSGGVYRSLAVATLFEEDEPVAVDQITVILGHAHTYPTLTQRGHNVASAEVTFRYSGYNLQNPRISATGCIEHTEDDKTLEFCLDPENHCTQ